MIARVIIIAAIRQELERQAKRDVDPANGVGSLDVTLSIVTRNDDALMDYVDGYPDLGLIADAILALMPAGETLTAEPGPIELSAEQVSAIADQIAGALAKHRGTLVAYKPFDMAGHFRIVDRVGISASDVCQHCGARRDEEHKRDCAIFAWDGDATTLGREERIEISDAERAALKWLRDVGSAASEGQRATRQEGAVTVSFDEMVPRGLVECETASLEPLRYRWTVTPLGLRAIEQEPL